MNDAHTPTTEQVRNNAALGASLAAFCPDEAGDIDWPAPGMRVEAKADIERWLAEHDRQVSEKAFWEGVDAVDRRRRRCDKPLLPHPPNHPHYF